MKNFRQVFNNIEDALGMTEQKHLGDVAEDKMINPRIMDQEFNLTLYVVDA